MAFSEAQSQDLSAKLRYKHVKVRRTPSGELSYIEGWHAIAEANRIFGFDAWDRETVGLECVWSDIKQDACRCAYTAKVRITVRAGDTVVVREGSGSGEAKGCTPGEAHDMALKRAETDATKRALTTFGNPFGLALYDKDKNGVSKPKANGADLPVLQLKSATGIPGAIYSDVDTFTDGFKQALGRVPTIKELFEIWDRNRDTVRSIRKMPTPKAVLADKLVDHFKDRAIALGKTDTPAKVGEDKVRRGKDLAKIDKSQLALPEPKRARSKEHLSAVARKPCLVCGRTPSQAHHLRFAQPRAMARKVSDEYVVPLCNIHHFELHQTGDERAWWNDKAIEPMGVARKLWDERRQGKGEDVLASTPP